MPEDGRPEDTNVDQASGCLGKPGHGRQREQWEQCVGKEGIGVLGAEEESSVAGEVGELGGGMEEEGQRRGRN